MKEISVTVTVGQGNERHNHDLDYRSTLQHVHECENGVIELVPYTQNYRKQINDLMKPYIDEYNQRVDERYQEAWNRYNNGAIKNKPRKRDYQYKSYDYCSEHEHDVYKNPITNKTEKIPLYREILIGLGDKSDRESGTITKHQAIAVFKKTLDDFKKNFPYFHVLGATMHCDESGFYHMHLNYKPIMKMQTSRGLNCSVGQDTILSAMGYEPEQSIINASDKAPLLFNSFRNKIYLDIENALKTQNLSLQYGVSKLKEPNKDSSKNQALENWQYAQDKARELQHTKNKVEDLLITGNFDSDSLKKVFDLTNEFNKNLTEIQNTPKSITRKGYLVEFKAFDQLKTLCKAFKDTLHLMVATIKELEKRVAHYRQYEDQVQELLEDNKQLQKENDKLKSIDNQIERAKESGLLNNYNNLLKENNKLKQQLGLEEKSQGYEKIR